MNSPVEVPDRGDSKQLESCLTKVRSVREDRSYPVGVEAFIGRGIHPPAIIGKLGGNEGAAENLEAERGNGPVPVAVGGTGPEWNERVTIMRPAQLIAVMVAGLVPSRPRVTPNHAVSKPC